MLQEIWPYGRGFYKVYVEDYAIKQKLDDWKDCKLSCRYFHVNGKNGWDFIFPSKLYNRIAGLLHLPLKEKNKNRVLAGRHSKVATNEKRHDLTKVNSVNLS